MNRCNFPASAPWLRHPVSDERALFQTSPDVLCFSSLMLEPYLATLFNKWLIFALTNKANLVQKELNFSFYAFSNLFLADPVRLRVRQGCIGRMSVMVEYRTLGFGRNSCQSCTRMSKVGPGARTGANPDRPIPVMSECVELIRGPRVWLRTALGPAHMRRHRLATNEEDEKTPWGLL